MKLCPLNRPMGVWELSKYHDDYTFLSLYYTVIFLVNVGIYKIHSKLVDSTDSMTID